VIGGGSWGTAFARLLALSGHQTTLVCRDPEQARAISTHHRNPRYLFDIELPESLAAASLADTTLEGAELIALAVPSRGFAETVQLIASRVPAEALLLSLTKGLDPGRRLRMSEILGQIAQVDRVAVLSGPNHAEEVARDYPTASVIALPAIELARRLKAVITTTRLRVYA
jgi:glycerol-3-phosphate dehydrogenase (NAD(P)+)